MLNGLSLFSGIGGIDVALSEYVRPIAYCEIDPYCQGVLFSRMARRDLSIAPIWPDINTLHTRKSGGLPCEHIDIIYGGFPCQDISVAGHGKGLEGERSGLFFEIVRLCSEIKPRFIFLENVPAITSRGGVEVVRQIASMGYDCRWCIISAASVGALHRRERWFLLAHTKHDGELTSEGRGSIRERLASGKGSEQQEEGIGKIERTGCLSTNVADPSSRKLEGFGKRTKCTESQHAKPSCCCYDGHADGKPSQQTDTQAESESGKKEAWRGSSRQYWPFESRSHWQETVSSMGKLSDGISDHVARLRALGNAVVPIQVKEAFEILMGIK